MDTELVVRARDGDQAAFASLAMTLGRRFHDVAYRILREAGAAQDATQQAIVDVWRDLPGLRDPGRFDAWSYRILVRACHAEARRRRRFAAEILPDGAEGPPIPDPIGVVADREQLERGFRHLSVEQRAVVVLRFYLDLGPAEIATALGIPAGTVGSRLSRALDALRAALEADARTVSPVSRRQEALR